MLRLALMLVHTVKLGRPRARRSQPPPGQAAAQRTIDRLSHTACTSTSSRGAFGEGRVPWPCRGQLGRFHCRRTEVGQRWCLHPSSGWEPAPGSRRQG